MGCMRGHYLHAASVRMDPAADPGAPGAAITLELCGSWDHLPPCPLAPHHTSHERNGDAVELRIVFAAEPAQEGEVRRRIDKALAAGSLKGPDGTTTHWSVRGTRAGVPSGKELDHAKRIAATE
jgi:hypothetical protein